MTLDQLLALAESYQYSVAAVFVAVPVLPLLFRLVHGRYGGYRAPWRYFYTVITYVTCIPGVFMLVTVLYSVLFLGTNVLDYNVLVYFLPIVSMVAALVFMRGSVDLYSVPGFRRLSGLLVLLGGSFFIVYVLDRLRIWAFFGGSIYLLAGGAIVLFFLLRWGAHALFGSPQDQGGRAGFRRRRRRPGTQSGI